MPIIDSGLDGVYSIINAFVVRFDHAIHKGGDVEMLRIIDAGEPAQLFNKGSALFLCSEM